MVWNILSILFCNLFYFTIKQAEKFAESKAVEILKEEFDLEIPDADAEKVVTVNDVVEYIKDNI